MHCYPLSIPAVKVHIRVLLLPGLPVLCCAVLSMMSTKAGIKIREVLLGWTIAVIRWVGSSFEGSLLAFPCGFRSAIGTSGLCVSLRYK